MSNLIDLNDYKIKSVLPILLQDHTTGRNILWGTASYESFGSAYAETAEISEEALLALPENTVQPRAFKAQQDQKERTKVYAEVFTPSRICKKMNDYADEELNPSLPEQYIPARILEITCGEAPFLVSRYDADTGELIPVSERIGLLDRKLKLISLKSRKETTWYARVRTAFQSTYGYEFQGDNLLIARINLLLSFIEYLDDRWHRQPTEEELHEIANIISWNLWQMDGLTDTIPFGTAADGYETAVEDDFWMTEFFGEQQKTETAPYCKTYDWTSNQPFEYRAAKGEKDMKFDFIIGNPPYQDEQISENADGSLKNYAPPIYDKFMDGAFKVSDKVELIHPARFLFNAGSTPKAWNEKMLNDEHFKVLYYEEDGHKVFPSLSTPLRGGVVISYRDADKKFGSIQAFTKYSEINDILHKVIYNSSFKTLMDIVYSRTSYRLTEKMHTDHPEARYKADRSGKNIGLLSKGHDYDMSSNIMALIPAIFFDKQPNDDKEYIRILGRENNKRIYKYIQKDYVRPAENLDYYKVYVAQANGSGEFGEPISEPVIENPGTGATETFLSIGKFNTITEAKAAEKYIKTKFSRALLSVLKVTQNGNKPVWKMIPLQDFTPNSDIDWSQSIADIDKQLYKKYGLSQEEIDFIESHVKEME